MEGGSTLLKSIREIIEPDHRFSAIVVADLHSGAVRPMLIADHHAAIASVELSSRVSNSVRTVFERARNAFLYAWFVYDLTPLAESQGYAALEMALRETQIDVVSGRLHRGLTERLQGAFDLGAFDDFTPAEAEISDRRAYFAQIISLVRHFRNDLAHGSDYVNMPGATLAALRLCCDLINHLYEGSPSKSD